MVVLFGEATLNLFDQYHSILTKHHKVHQASSNRMMTIGRSKKLQP